MGVFIITDHKATLSGQKSPVPTELLCGDQMGGMKIGPSEKKITQTKVAVHLTVQSGNKKQGQYDFRGRVGGPRPDAEDSNKALIKSHCSAGTSWSGEPAYILSVWGLCPYFMDYKYLAFHPSSQAKFRHLYFILGLWESTEKC